MFARLMTTAAAAAVATGVGAGAAAADYALTILHTNDFHDRFEPISRFDGPCSVEDNDEGKCFGGAARLVTAIEDARSRTNNYVLVDAGDMFQGSLFYTYYKGDVAAEMMNKIGYDLFAIGNHEFNHGPETIGAFVDKVDFPVLMANADISAEPALAGKVLKSTVLERGGEQIGFIGLTPQDNDELSSPGPNITFTDPIPAVQAEVDRLTAEGINKIIVLSHSGFEADKRIAAATTGIDIIVGGHSNTLLSNTSDRAAGPYPMKVGEAQIVQAYAYGKYLGELNVTFDDNGVVTEAVGEPVLIDASVAEDETMKARIAELAQPLEEIRQQVVADAADKIEGDRSVCRVMECPMGNLVADAMLDRVADQGVTIAIANSGGLRSSIDAGEVTMGEVMTVLPFQNTLSTFEISGQTLIDALENGVSQIEDIAGRFPQVAGMKFTFDPTVAPNEGRVQEVMVAQGDSFVPIDPAASYKVVTNNYVRNGGDGYGMFAGDDKNAYDYGPDLADVTAEYMAENAPYAPYTDGRIAAK
ncbi:bifunctional UDP-sugar hydrolase/5'-nucleotidase [Nereida sp. MMG025]|uniref:bifunctional metallophosphatase/5'-nucleotidase n=1 Tax=Nereida sp. MMG025 TaxID=2909981 RepID=UPI001F461D7A|nr:bifunctional metallophosphatase/5'-nucleotidase [Nereida sp. MMG025]MCF6443990.1 5'-nucleotidase/apyrase family protein [Nereida sp. MMG025]